MAVFAYIANQPRVITVTIPHADASQLPVTDPCGLTSVVCEDEQPVIHAIQAVSEALGKEVTEETKKRITYLHEKTSEAGIPFYHAVKTIYCESQWYNIKSSLPEESYGLAQIHLPAHKIPVEKALDPYYSIEWLATHWDTAKWYGYDRETGTCTNGLTINL